MLVILLVVRLNSVFLNETDIPCDRVVPDSLQIQKGYNFKCIERATYFFKKNYMVINTKGFVDLDLKYKTDIEISFLGFSEGKASFSVLKRHTNKLLGHSLDVGTIKSSSVTSKYILGVSNSTKKIKIISDSDNDLRSKVYISDINPVKKIIASEYFKFSSKASNMSRFIISAVLLLMILVYFIIYMNNYNSIIYNAVLLLLVYGVTVIFLGLPYATNEGAYDPFDDTAYLAWSHSIGYNLDGLVKNEPYPATIISNTHSWGTGFFYAPVFWFSKTLAKFINNHNETRIAHGLSQIFNTVSNYRYNNGYNFATYVDITCLAYIYTFLSIFIFFISFRLITNSNFAASLLGFAIFSGTSLIKWTLIRNIFSHVPEMLVLSMMTYVFVLMYYKKKNTMFNYCTYIVLGIILAQIRREDILFIILPIYYEYLKEKISRTFFKRLTVTVIGVLLAQILLQLSNYLTLANSFWSFPTESLVQIKDMPSLVMKNFNLVLFSKNSGFFTLNVFVPLALLSLIYLKKSFIKIIPFVILIVGYLIMCMINPYPTGCEWQNRLLLKIFPIIFCVIAYLLYSVKRTYKVIVYFLIIVGCFYQLYLYVHMLPKGMPLYSDLLSDYDILHPKLLVEYAYMLPVLIVFIALFLLWGYILCSRLVSLLKKYKGSF